MKLPSIRLPLKYLLIFLSSLGPYILHSQALELTLAPTYDASIFDESGAIGDSLGPHLFAGRTQNGHDQLRRALLSFDATALPANATLLNAELRLYVDNSPFAAPTGIKFSVHPLQEFWQEGSSNAGSPGGQGAVAEVNDPTWLHSAYSNTFWSAAGGTMGALSAESIGDFGAGDILSLSSAQLTADVQSWRETPSSNFGWIILGDENTAKSARRFASRANTFDPGPQLVLTYQIPEANSLLLLFLGLGILYKYRTCC